MEKLRKAMRKEDGFTLVELLAVIVILGIILAIAIPAIGNVIENSRNKAAEQDVLLIVDAARLYVVGENLESDTEADIAGITVKELIDKGYLENVDAKYLDKVIADNVDTTAGAPKYVLVTPTGGDPAPTTP